MPERKNWRLTRERIDPAAAFDRHWPDPAERSVWVVEPTGAAVVLGSTQPASVVLPDSGVEIVRRRSGGGAVLVRPGALVWVDVFLPAGDPLWERDVGRAFHWLGRTWADALSVAGAPAATVHEGRLRVTRWSSLVCFAGLGPGEVTVDGAKVVGISQRRARKGALFQCAVLLAWDPADLLALLDMAEVDRTRAGVDLASAARGLDVDADELITTFLAALP